MEQITLVAAIIAAVAAVLSAVIAARSSHRQGERVAELARRAEMHEDLTRWIDWAVSGDEHQALHAIRMLRQVVRHADLSAQELDAVASATMLVHQRLLMLGALGLEGPAADLPVSNEGSHTEAEEG